MTCPYLKFARLSIEEKEFFVGLDWIDRFCFFLHNTHSLSHNEDTFVFVLAKEPYRDLVLDLGWSGVERVSEFVIIVTQQYYRLKEAVLPVKFVESVQFNNARTPKKPQGM